MEKIIFKNLQFEPDCRRVNKGSPKIKQTEIFKTEKKRLKAVHNLAVTYIYHLFVFQSKSYRGITKALTGMMKG